MADEPVKTEQPTADVPASSDQTQKTQTVDAGTEQSVENKPNTETTPQPEVPAMQTPSEPQSASVGGGGRKIAMLVIVFLVLALGAVVAGIISGQRSRQARQTGQTSEIAAVPTPTPTEEADSLTTQYEQQADSDEIGSIESDLQSTSFNGVDAELTQIDQEFSAQE